MRVDWEKYDITKARAIANKYAKLTVTEMMFNITKLGLVDKAKLLNSVKSSIRSQQGEVNRVQFSYEFYGRFLENGAKNVFGKGVTLQPKSWRNSALEKNKEMLDEDFSKFYADLIIGEIKVDNTKMEM
jgi:hypothetical protein